jgi:putative transposase
VKALPDLRALDRDPYTGHAVLLGRRQCPGQDTGCVLGRFAARPGRARLAYRAFVAAGIPAGAASGVSGGGRRSTPSGEAESTTRRTSGCSGVRPS